MKTIKENVNAKKKKKKSRFIADLIYVSSEEEAQANLEQIRKKYYDARHHCFAYRILEKDTILERASDDGEPSGTAGAPMLNLLSKNDLMNVLLVVTRYFGGILLGTGGLVRAYTGASQQAIKKASIVTQKWRL